MSLFYGFIATGEISGREARGAAENFSLRGRSLRLKPHLFPNSIFPLDFGQSILQEKKRKVSLDFPVVQIVASHVLLQKFPSGQNPGGEKFPTFPSGGCRCAHGNWP